MAENPSYKYNLPIRVLHWLMSFMFISMIISGYIMSRLDPNVASYKWQIYGIHKSIGIIFLFLAIIRIIIRLNSYIPPYKYEFSQIIRLLSNVVQKGFYIFFFILPITGYLSSTLAGYDILLFGYKLPQIFDINKELAGQNHYIHSILPYASIALIFLHVAGVIKHRYFDKKDILERIW